MEDLDEKKFHIDGKLANADDIIIAAEEYGYRWRQGLWGDVDPIEILRKNGHTVGHASEIKKEQG